MKNSLLALILLFAVFCSAQTQSAPLSASEDISGMYTFLKEGEFVQLTVEDGRLTGFVSRYGDTDSDKGAVLDQLFKEGQIKGNTIHFVTKEIHGTWFEFEGTLGHGDVKDPGAEGYRIVKGKLTQYTDDEKNKGKPSARSRELTMKSFPTSELIGNSK
jgi:hypothetical protein